MFIDKGENLYVKGLRASEELEGRDVTRSCLFSVAKWAMSKGALMFVGTSTDYIRRPAKGIMDMVIHLKLSLIAQFTSGCKFITEMYFLVQRSHEHN